MVPTCLGLRGTFRHFYGLAIFTRDHPYTAHTHTHTYIDSMKLPPLMKSTLAELCYKTDEFYDPTEFPDV